MMSLSSTNQSPEIDLMHELNREKCLLREGNSKLAGGEDA
jgi:hypothetical protein